MKLIGIYFLIYISWRENQVTSSKINYFDGFIKYLNEDSKVHQVAFIADDSSGSVDPVMNSLMAAVNSNFPSVSLSYREIKSNLREPYLKFSLTRSTTLFVLQWINESTIDTFTDFVFRLQDYSIGTSLPRCLVVDTFNSTHEHINRTLHSFWKKKYLDVTLLTYDKDSKVTIESSPGILPLLSQINPFFKNFSSQVASAESQWFPNKVRDLNGYKLNLAIQPLNYSSDLLNVEAEDFLQILKEAMNFEANVIPFTMDTQHIMSEENESEFNQVLSKWRTELHKTKYEIVLNLVNVNFDSTVLQRLRILQIDSVNIVVPKEVKPTGEIQVSSEFWHMIIATVITITVIRFTVFLLKFRRRTWQTLNISQFIIGMPLPEDPEDWSERIVFGSLLLTCIVYTSYFYSTILDVTFRPAPEISTLAELLKSNLTPLIDVYSKYIFKDYSNPDIQQLIEKSSSIEYEDDCLYILAEHRNVSCVLSNAASDINDYEAEYSYLNVKILPETIVNGVTTFIGGCFSPYMDRFNEIILRASELGLINYYPQNGQNLRSNSLKPEFITKDKLLPVLFGVLAIGYSLSIIAFLFEVITAKVRSRFLHKRNVSISKLKRNYGLEKHLYTQN